MNRRRAQTCAFLREQTEKGDYRYNRLLSEPAYVESVIRREMQRTSAAHQQEK